MSRPTSSATEQLAALWPAPASARLSRSTASDQTGYWVVPSKSRPRLLVPQAVSEADRMLVRHGGTRAQVAARAVWRAVHRSGVAARLPVRRLSVTPDPAGIEAFLASVLGRPVRVGVLLGPPRANLKPVLQVFDATGSTIAYAKLGLSPLTAALLENEATTLSRLGQLTTHTFTAPTPLRYGLWREVPVLVQQALPLSQSNRAPVEPPIPVMTEIAGLFGISAQGLGDTSFLSAVDPGSQSSWHGLELAPFARLHDVLGGVGSCPFGSWHGDFGPWNMATDGSRVEVWDWERFEGHVPVGFDAAHYRAQQGVASQLSPEASWTAMTSAVRAVLGALDLDRDVAGAVAGCYLLAICARYRRDAVDGPTPALRRRMQWLAAAAAVAVPHLQELSDDLSA